MEPLGFCGILKLTTQVIHRNLRHFLCIAFILAIPKAFLLAFTPYSSSHSAQAFAHTISLLYNFYASHGNNIPSPPYTPQPYPLSFVTIAILVFSIFFSFLTLPLLTFSVCRAVLNKNLAFKSSLLAVRQSALNLILTVLCVTGVLFGLCVAMLILMIIIAAGLLTIGIDPAIVTVIWSIIMVGGALYLGIAWSLANTVAMLEEKRGWEAMKRSVYLVDGSKWVVIGLAVVFGVFGVCLMFLPNSASEGASVMWRWSCAVVSVGMQAIIALYCGASTVVLYMSCKSRVKEPLDTLIALSPQFGPTKYMDLESARFADPLVLPPNKS